MKDLEKQLKSVQEIIFWAETLLSRMKCRGDKEKQDCDHCKGLNLLKQYNEMFGG